ncbi:MAG: DUF4921 family protein [Actinobacteria bacterium]|nr:DUF4921 family protein [Actinomycetota bacterium]
MGEKEEATGFPLPEIRRDALSGAWSVLATGRSRRPGAAPSASPQQACPFCPGNEALTPPEVWSAGREEGPPDSPGWRIRVVPNLYPALVPEAGKRGWRRGGRVGMPARGDHEVIIHSPHHGLSLGEMDAREATGLLGAWQARFRHFADMPHVRYVQIIVNHKREAGASLEHPHTQVFALPLVPRGVRDELRESRRRGEGCPLCKEAEEAAADGRVAAEGEGWVAFMPYASRSPFEMRFAPLIHGPDFASAGEGALQGLAEVLTRSLGALSRLLANPAYNLWLHTAPCDGRDYHYYHWHLEMVPRVIVSAGFELATGMYLNVMDPLEAARQLRLMQEEEGRNP